MNALLGLLPLLVFVIVDMFASPRTAVICALICAVGEVVYTYATFGELDEISMGSLLLIVLLGFLAIKKNDVIWFKLQPVVLGVFLSLYFFVMQALHKPVLVTLMQKYPKLLPPNIQPMLTDPDFLRKFSDISFYLGFGFFIHAGAVCLAAFLLSKWWWIVIRGIGLYLMMGICMVWGFSK